MTSMNSAMIYPLEMKMRNRFNSLFLSFVVALIGSGLFAAEKLDKEGIPLQPNPPRLVNVIQAEANPFSKSQIDQLEAQLVDYSNRTSTQIALVIVNSFQGYDKASYATDIGHKWGVGQKGFDNGVVVLLKPKETATDKKGDVFIAVGYGLEGIIPDAVAKRIIEVEMIPSFKKGDYYTGISKSIATLQSLALKEFTAKEYVNKHKKAKRKGGFWGILPILIFIFFFSVLRRSARGRRTYGSGGTDTLLTGLFLGSMMNRSSGSSWSDFSSGGGGFGGFGGGGFGGGGAGGSW